MKFNVIRTLKELHFKSLFKLSSLNDKPILICGCGRSGTSLLLAVLDAHPEIHCLPYETNIFNYRRRFNSVKLNHWNHLRKVYDVLLRHPIKPTARRWCEKTPSNVWYIPEILEEFGEGVQIIHIVRDGRDVVTSIHPTSKESYWIRPERWINDVSLGLQYKNHPQVKTVKYENLINNYDQTVAELLEFLGLSMTEDMKNFSEKTSIRSINAWESGVKPIYKTSISKWKKPEYQAIIDELYQKQEPYQLLEKLGYK